MNTNVPFEPSSPFMQNYFCIIEKYRVAFIVIAKNAVTTLFVLHKTKRYYCLYQDTLFERFMQFVAKIKEWYQSDC